jgi:quercetin dioxygenase-like cupin family protein
LIEPHTQPFEVIFYLLEGMGSLSVDTGESEFLAGTMISIAPGVPRGWKNNTLSALRLLVIKKLK